MTCTGNILDLGIPRLLLHFKLLIFVLPRYIEVFESNASDMDRAIRTFGSGGRGGAGDRRGGGGGDRDRRGGRCWLVFDVIFLHITLHQRPRGYVVKLNGLPFRASEREIEDWLAEAADPLEVVIEMDRLTNHRNGWNFFLTKCWESGTH